MEGGIMSNYKLTYFDINGGRAEPLRIGFHIAGIDFEDNRISFPEFAELRSSMPFNAVPVLEIDGVQITQSNAMSRFIGKKAGLYPVDDVQALYCDEVLEAFEDLTHYIVRTFGLQGEELKLAREKLVDGWMSTYLKGLEKLLQRGGGEYYADNQLTMADIRSFVQIRSLCSGSLDHIPVDIVQRVAPGLVEHQARIGSDSRIAGYYATHG
ncbi:glutathione S-transferase [Gynuella sunshinyii YC6258]|uniref:Glutathione S-transferase n=2 Tax=Gynuella sunshinyii TaxID=1445505 RepID=A0A0C5VTP2_9GAMM|nr:glutathione S-transferase [Gynuella sunshinyii YC6258]